MRTKVATVGDDRLLLSQLLVIGQLALEAHLSGVRVIGRDLLLSQTFDAGRACGLTDKEIVQELFITVRTVLRPPSASA